MQTLGARLIRSRLSVGLKRERIELDDGDFLDLDWVAGWDGNGQRDSSPLVLVLHGLEGSANSGYARQMYRELRANGLQAVGLNSRGCSGEPNRLARAYHSGETGDLSRVLGVLRERHPQRPIGAVGFSLGGNVLLKYLGERGQEGQRGQGGQGTDEEGKGIDAAVAISVPFDLSAGADYMEQGFSKTYRVFLVRKLQRKVRAKAGIMDGKVDISRALAARTFREFDDAVIVPIHGFEDAEDYYRCSSSAQFLESITTPTLLVHSLDDPFLPPAAVPTGIASDNPHVRTEFTRSGGHVGFVSGHPWAPLFWGERRAAEFLAEQLAGVS
jgi:predicted alpha/beta-fold hydrolase